MVALPLLQMPMWDMTWLTPAFANVGTLSANANCNFGAIDTRLKAIEQRLGGGMAPLHTVNDGQLFDMEKRIKALEGSVLPGIMIRPDGVTINTPATALPTAADLIAQVKTLSEQVAALQRDLADRPRSGVSPW